VSLRFRSYNVFLMFFIKKCISSKWIYVCVLPANYIVTNRCITALIMLKTVKVVVCKYKKDAFAPLFSLHIYRTFAHH